MFLVITLLSSLVKTILVLKVYFLKASSMSVLCVKCFKKFI